MNGFTQKVLLENTTLAARAAFREEIEERFAGHLTEEEIRTIRGAMRIVGDELGTCGEFRRTRLARSSPSSSRARNLYIYTSATCRSGAPSVSKARNFSAGSLASARLRIEEELSIQMPD